MRNTRDDVVAAALRVLGTQGLEGCSMRRVAAELDVQPSALYHHVPNKQYLLALMADEIVGDIGVDSRGGAVGSPRQLCVQLRDAMLSVRDGADVVATATAFRLGISEIEAKLAKLVGRDGARTLLLFTFGHAQSTQTHRQAAEFGALIPASAVTIESEEQLDEMPDDVRLDASFERGLDIILAGLAA